MVAKLEKTIDDLKEKLAQAKEENTPRINAAQNQHWPSEAYSSSSGPEQGLLSSGRGGALRPLELSLSPVMGVGADEETTGMSIKAVPLLDKPSSSPDMVCAETHRDSTACCVDIGCSGRDHGQGRQTGSPQITNCDRFFMGGTGSDGNRELWCKQPSEKE
ncbi:hypothetical protein GH733_001409 [Mirounga leonina]|nr:hypothetical protein GH733_001409 [Mirounga leonina]